MLDTQWDNFRTSKAGETAAEDLSLASHTRCYYCHYNQGSDIDHFKPKTDYPSTAFRWANFNWSCSICNAKYKRSEWNRDLLNPGGRIQTADFFVLNETTGELLPDLSRPAADQKKALETTRILGLNSREQLCEWRRDYAQEFLADLRADVAKPSNHGETQLLRYLRPSEEFRTVIYLLVRSRDAVIQADVATWVGLSHQAARTLCKLAWWP